MTEKDLLEQLNNCKTVHADKSWIRNNREVLKQQILNGEEINELGMISQFNILMSRILQPAHVALIIAVFFVASGVFGWYGSMQAKPGDSLYVAKIAKEKAQFAITFDSKSKARLNVEFAKNRLAEIDQVLSEEADGNTEKIEKLKTTIRKEINIAKQTLAENQPENQDGNLEDEDVDFFTAGVGKNDEKIDISITETNPLNCSDDSEEKEGECVVQETEILDTPEITTITEEEVVAEVEEEAVEETIISETEKMLNEAEELLNSEEFEAATEKLEEVNQLIEEEGKDVEPTDEEIQKELGEIIIE